MTIGEIIHETMSVSSIQFLHECVVGARAVNGPGTKGAKKGHGAYTRVEFQTQQMTPNDLLYWSGELGRPNSRKPQYIGVVVWIPYEAYESAIKAGVVPPDDPPKEPV